MNRLRMAVVGVGALGRHHARILSGFENVELAAVVDARPEQGQQIAAQTGSTWYPDTREIPGRIDAAVIAVPTVFHPDLAIPLLQQGIPLLIEKPLAATLPDAERIHDSARRAGVLVQVGHVERFNPAFRLLQSQVRHPLYLRCQRVSPYTFRSTDIGVVHDLMIHDIDLALALTDSSVQRVESFGAVTIGPHEDMAMARLRMASGAIVDLTAGRMSPLAERSLQVWTPEGWFSADLTSRVVQSWQPAAPFRQSPELLQAIIRKTANPAELREDVFGKWLEHSQVTAANDDALTAELREFTDCVLHGRMPQVSSEKGLAAMMVADRILQNMACWSYGAGSDESAAAA